ncbi:porin [Cupriavidus yeoncheonensis]|nr:porin [Cupriavidus yeoncheonensis]
MEEIMTKRLYIGAMLVTSAQLAAAQPSVTLYGIADVGVEYLSNANAAGNKLVRMTTGNVAASRWGLRGVEDLGSGTKAVFVLENGYDIDTGVINQGGRLFGRQAFVGLENQWGRVTLGRQPNAFLDVLGNYDPLALAGRYSAITFEPNFVGRYDNSAKYTGKFGPWTAIALYSFARGTSITANGTTSFGTETPGDLKSDRAYAGGVQYAADNFGATVIYDQQQGTRGIAGQNSGQRDQRLAVAGNYSFGNSKVFAGYRWLNGDIGVAAGAPTRRTDYYWVGYRQQIMPALALTAAGYYLNDRRSGADPWILVGSADYSLSKRTDLYLTVGYVKNKNNSNYGLNGLNNTINPGQNQLGVTMNIRHIF